MSSDYLVYCQSLSFATAIHFDQGNVNSINTEAPKNSLEAITAAKGTCAKMTRINQFILCLIAINVNSLMSNMCTVAKGKKYRTPPSVAGPVPGPHSWTLRPIVDWGIKEDIATTAGDQQREPNAWEIQVLGLKKEPTYRKTEEACYEPTYQDDAPTEENLWASEPEDLTLD